MATREGRSPVSLHWFAVLPGAAFGLLLVVGAIALCATLGRRSAEPPVLVATELPAQPAPVLEPVPQVAPPLAPEPVAAPAPPTGAPAAEPANAVQEPLPPARDQTAPAAPAALTAEPKPIAAETKLATAPVFKLRTDVVWEELAKQLLSAPEVKLEAVPGATARTLQLARKDAGKVPHPAPDVLIYRADLAGLPVRMGMDCHLSGESSAALDVLSKKLRENLGKAVEKAESDPRPSAAALRRLMNGTESDRSQWTQSEAIPTLVQLLMAQDKPIRLLLVEQLGQIRGREASLALARRALFDLSDEVREAAVRELAKRPSGEYRPTLLDGLRYPWAPAADHAAEAIAFLRDDKALPALVDLLDAPDPAAPFTKAGKDEKAKGTPMVRELVRVNHLGNCVMCHAPSFSQNELVRGLVPAVDKPVPPTFSPQYYAGNTTGVFVRADVTYLKQDFAVPQPVANPGLWPVHQRFDYLVRTRSATKTELGTAAKRRSDDYPQRDAVLFALREVTGRDVGSQSAAWREFVREER